MKRLWLNLPNKLATKITLLNQKGYPNQATYLQYA
nr:MAG TPA: hypothetical protein [Caudoviricetes sp.]DAY06824.1 MAG TPA: hypothetical protein [Caudoviricetes sp.]